MCSRCQSGTENAPSYCQNSFFMFVESKSRKHLLLLGTQNEFTKHIFKFLTALVAVMAAFHLFFKKKILSFNIQYSTFSVDELFSSLTCASSARACVLPLSLRSRLCTALWEKALGRVSWLAWPSPVVLSDTPTSPGLTPFSSTEWGSIPRQKYHW